MLLAVLVIFQLYIVFAPPPGTIAQVAVMALATYLTATALAFWADRTRAVRARQSGRNML